MPWYATPRSAERTHAPHLERAAINQMPKDSSHKDAKLYRYDGTDLYQWYSRVNDSVFYDAFSEPFVIEEIKP